MVINTKQITILNSMFLGAILDNLVLVLTLKMLQLSSIFRYHFFDLFQSVIIKEEKNSILCK